jgi:hypothetical protein
MVTGNVAMFLTFLSFSRKTRNVCKLLINREVFDGAHATTPGVLTRFLNIVLFDDEAIFTGNDIETLTTILSKSLLNNERMDSRAHGRFY